MTALCLSVLFAFAVALPFGPWWAVCAAVVMAVARLDYSLRVRM